MKSSEQIDQSASDKKPHETQSDSMKKTVKKEFDTDDFKRVDERDNSDSSKDWDAEKSRTGRQK